MAGFPDRYDATYLASDARAAPVGTRVSLAGRLRAIRPMGGITFAQLQDRSGIVQITFNRRDLPGETVDLVKRLRVGSHVGVAGSMWTTNKGEHSVGVHEIELLAQPTRPLPDKWVGVTDRELIFRRRYLDLLYNDQSRERFLRRSRLISLIRNYLDKNDFLEVETPIMQPKASGASARPFITHHQALGVDFYLRIAPETYLKRVMVSPFERIYEIGRNFRNEGLASSHLQEFTMLEWYAAYWNYRDNMKFASELISSVIQDVMGSLTIRFNGMEIDFSLPWNEIDFRTAVLEASGVDLASIRTRDALRQQIVNRSIHLDAPEQSSYGTLVDLLYKKLVRPHLIQPTLLLHHPEELVPLARRNSDDPSVLDMFQIVVGGWEIAKAYSELVDPVEQRQRLTEQAALRESGDDEAMMLEEDFIEAMEYGMPPMSGLGLGIDRLVAILTDAPSVRDVVLFPPLRPDTSSPAQ